MQDEINTKVVALVIRTGSQSARLTTHILQEAMKKFLSQVHDKKMSSKEGIHHGKQTVGQLMRQNTGLTNLEITDGNIRSFEKIARKYNIDFALAKEKDSVPPKYLVFFKARDVDVMEAAFKEYAKSSMELNSKPSIKKQLTRVQEQMISDKAHEMFRQKERGIER